MAKKLLIVDTDCHLRRLVQVNLERQGYEVVTAADGNELLFLATTDHPDIIVLDIAIRPFDVSEVLRCLKGDPSTRDIMVIMLSSKAGDADVFRGWGSGVDVVLTKPFNPMDLVNCIRRLFDDHNLPPPSAAAVVTPLPRRNR